MNKNCNPSSQSYYLHSKAFQLPDYLYRLQRFLIIFYFDIELILRSYFKLTIERVYLSEQLAE